MAAIALTCAASAAMAQAPPATATAAPTLTPAAPPSDVPSPRAAAREAFDRGEKAASDLRLADALAAYDEAFARDPSAPFAPVARARAAELRARSEGAFVPLARLEEVRRDAAKNRDPEVIAALDRDARAFPDGKVRGEALLVAAQAHAHVFDDPARALSALEAILADPSADRSTRALALSEALVLYRQRADLDGALAAVSRDPELLPAMTREVRADVRRVRIAWAAAATLAAFVACALWGGVRAARRLGDVRALGAHLSRPRPLLFAFYVGAGGALFVRAHGGEGDPLPFIALGLALALALTLARLWSLATPAPTRPTRALRASTSTLALFALAYLILWKTNPAYLTPLGL